MTEKQYQEIIYHRLLPSLISVENHNQYTQGPERIFVGEGYSDCSSLVWWLFLHTFGCDVGEDTAAQIVSPELCEVPVPIQNGIPVLSFLHPGDLLYFRGKDIRRQHLRYVGHVEIVTGPNEISGHGEGIGPVRKNLTEYCLERRQRPAPAPICNQGLICVKRLRYDCL